MDETEQRAILEAIARDEDAYPRDRIAAIKALGDLDEGASTSSREFTDLDAGDLAPRRARRAA